MKIWLRRFGKLTHIATTPRTALIISSGNRESTSRLPFLRNLIHRIKRIFFGVGLAAIAVNSKAQSQHSPSIKTDPRLVVSTGSITAFQGGGWSVLGTTFTTTNPGVVQFPNAQQVVLPSTQSFSVLGTTFTSANPGVVVSSWTQVNASTIAVVGLSGLPISVSVNGSTFTTTNPGYVQFPNAQQVVLPSTQSFSVLLPKRYKPISNCSPTLYQ